MLIFSLWFQTQLPREARQGKEEREKSERGGGREAGRQGAGRESRASAAQDDMVRTAET